MTALDYILDGLEAELALERELGVRLVECDRSLLAEAGGPPGGRPLPTTTGGALSDRALPAAQPVDATSRRVSKEEDLHILTRRDVASTSETAPAAVQPSTSNPQPEQQPPTSNLQPEQQPPTSNLQPPTSLLPFVFLHDKPLSPAGNEMMAKIITALGATAETAPIIIEQPVPKAKVYVVLGGLALRKFQPTLRGAPGMWLKTAKGAPVLITYSPEYILRFKEITPAVKKIKQDMWQSLKGVLQRII